MADHPSRSPFQDRSNLRDSSAANLIRNFMSQEVLAQVDDPDDTESQQKVPHSVPQQRRSTSATVNQMEKSFFSSKAQAHKKNPKEAPGTRVSSHPPVACTLVSFEPGALGLELEGVVESHGKRLGCRVFKVTPGGQAARHGSVREGDVVVMLDGVHMLSEPFDDITKALLKRQGVRRLIGFVGVSPGDAGGLPKGICKTPSSTMAHPTPSTLRSLPGPSPTSLKDYRAPSSRPRPISGEALGLSQVLGDGFNDPQTTAHIHPPPPLVSSHMAGPDRHETAVGALQARAGWAPVRSTPSTYPAAVDLGFSSHLDGHAGGKYDAGAERAEGLLRKEPGGSGLNAGLQLGLEASSARAGAGWGAGNGLATKVDKVAGVSKVVGHGGDRENGNAPVLSQGFDMGGMGSVGGVGDVGLPLARSRAGSLSRSLEAVTRERTTLSAERAHLQEEVMQVQQALMEREGALVGQEVQVDVLQAELSATEGELRRVKSELVASEASRRQASPTAANCQP
ncbi:unnamed protein product [Discosporangium mesarthrocarpum]